MQIKIQFQNGIQMGYLIAKFCGACHVPLKWKLYIIHWNYLSQIARVSLWYRGFLCWQKNKNWNKDLNTKILSISNSVVGLVVSWLRSISLS